MKNFGKTTDIKDIITVEYEADNAVLYSTSQSLTNNQKAQARTNIGAGTSSFDGNYNSLSNKPTIPTKTSQLNNDSNFATTSQVEAKYTKPAGGIPKTDLATAVQNSLTAADNAVKYTSQSLTDAQKVQARANIGAGTSNFSGSYNDLTNKPSIPAAVSIVQSTGTSTSSVMSQKATTDAVNGKLSKTDNTNIEVLGTKKATTTLGGNQLYAPNGVIFGGSAAAAGLVTRGICGVSTPSVGGACTKENLYINYDGNNDFNAGRQIVLNAGTTGNHLGSNMYQYTVPRGDIVKNWVEAKGYATSVKVNGNTIASSGGVVDIGNVVTDVSGLMPKAGGTFTGEVTFNKKINLGQGDANCLYLGSDGRLNGPENRTLFGLVSGATTFGHTAYALKFRGSGTRPTFNGNDLALKSDIPTDFDKLTRIQKQAYTGGDNTVKYFKLASFPVYNSGGNYASFIITGRMGGWQADNMSFVNMILYNRNGEGGGYINVANSAFFNLCDIVMYREADGTSTAYLKVKSYYTFDINVNTYQATNVYTGTDDTPTGTLKWTASEQADRLAVSGGVAYVNGFTLPKQIKINGATHNPNSEGLVDLGTTPNTDTGATSVTVNGSGNAVTSASYNASTRKLTLTKGTTFLTSHQSIKKLNTDHTTAQPVNASENITSDILTPGNTIDLHKIAKTGSYDDLNYKHINFIGGSFVDFETFATDEIVTIDPSLFDPAPNDGDIALVPATLNGANPSIVRCSLADGDQWLIRGVSYAFPSGGGITPFCMDDLSTGTFGSTTLGRSTTTTALYFEDRETSVYGVLYGGVYSTTKLYYLTDVSYSTTSSGSKHTFVFTKYTTHNDKLIKSTDKIELVSGKATYNSQTSISGTFYYKILK